jgi:hypothetical protein
MGLQPVVDAYHTSLYIMSNYHYLGERWA